MTRSIVGRRDFMRYCTAMCSAVTFSPSVVLAAAKKQSEVDWQAMRADPVRKQISGRPDLDNILALFPRTSGEPAFDPEKIAENIEKLRTEPDIKTGHPFLDLSDMYLHNQLHQMVLHQE